MDMKIKDRIISGVYAIIIFNIIIFSIFLMSGYLTSKATPNLFLGSSIFFFVIGYSFKWACDVDEKNSKKEK